MSANPSPSESLSTDLVDRLIAAGLLRAKRRDALIAKIAAGDMKGEEWKLEIELAQEKAVLE